MSAPDYYEQYLLGLAVCSYAEKSPPGAEFSVFPITGGFWMAQVVADDYTEPPWSYAPGPTLEAALRALLDDLGVEYEERPPDLGRLAITEAEASFLNYLRVLYAREPLTAISLLAGDQ